MTQGKVRFWVYVNGGYVRIALADQEGIEHTEGGPCEEGYHYRTTTWVRDGGVIERQSFTQALDCDGRMDHYFEDLVEVAPGSLAAVEAYDEPEIKLPEWRESHGEIRDYAAEAAGY